MNARKLSPELEIRMLDVDALCVYLSMGKTRATEYAEKIGAKRKIGKRTLFDRRIIDAALDDLGKEGGI